MSELGEPAAAAVEPAAPSPRPKNKNEGEKASPEEIGGPKGPEPTRFGDWERKGRCIDF